MQNPYGDCPNQSGPPGDGCPSCIWEQGFDAGIDYAASDIQRSPTRSSKWMREVDGSDSTVTEGAPTAITSLSGPWTAILTQAGA